MKKDGSQYRCESCGKTFLGMEVDSSLYSITILAGDPDNKSKHNLPRVRLHECNEDSWGVAYFIGTQGPSSYKNRQE